MYNHLCSLYFVYLWMVFQVFRVNTIRDNIKHDKRQISAHSANNGDCDRDEIKSELCAGITPTCKVDQHRSSPTKPRVVFTFEDMNHNYEIAKKNY